MEIKEFILDYSKWRSGGDGMFKVGEGRTKLLNAQGFMCCLGQAALQFNCDLKPANILDESTPASKSYLIPFLTKKGDEFADMGWVMNTELSAKAMGINDDEHTSPEEKIEKLTALFANEGIKMIVINKPTTTERVALVKINENGI